MTPNKEKRPKGKRRCHLRRPDSGRVSRETGPMSRPAPVPLFHVEHFPFPRTPTASIIAVDDPEPTPPRSVPGPVFRQMSRIIAIANQKGGVGKTTTAINLGACLAVAERSTLVVDADPQGNATGGLGVDRDELDLSIYDVLLDGASADDALLHGVHFPHLDLLPSNRDLLGAEVAMTNAHSRETLLRHALEPIRDRYEYIIIDSPPSLGLLTVNTLAAADTVLIPIQCEFYALEGLTQLLNTVRLVQRSLNQGLQIEGVFLTMFSARLNLVRQVAEEVR